MKLYFASGNAHKREEMQRLFPGHQIVIPGDEGIAFDPEETADSFFGNALIKAESLWDLVHCPVLADDSGICVDALGGEPGIHSARYGSENGINLDSAGRNRLLLSKMGNQDNRACRFVCNLVLYLGPERFWSIQETLEGEIVTIPCGSGGFGYDPIVYLPEFGKTVAELEPAEKDQCSHRGKAGRHISSLLAGFTTKQE